MSRNSTISLGNKMIFSKLNSINLVNLALISNSRNPLVLQSPKYLVICRNNSSNNSFDSNGSSRITVDQTVYSQYFNFKHLAILVASTTFIGMVKLYIDQITNNETSLNISDQVKCLFNIKDLQAKEKDDKGENKEVSLDFTFLVS